MRAIIGSEFRSDIEGMANMLPLGEKAYYNSFFDPKGLA